MTIFDYIRCPITPDNFVQLLEEVPMEITDYWRATPSRSKSENIKEIQELLINYQTDKCCVNDRFTRYDPNDWHAYDHLR